MNTRKPVASYLLGDITAQYRLSAAGLPELRLLPAELASPFRVAEFSKRTRLRGRDAYSAVRVLAALGVVRPAAPIGRAMAFEIAPRGSAQNA